MNIISIAMLALGLVGILGGFLYGKKRGLTKATVRLILIGLSALGAFVLRESVTQTVLNTPIEGEKSVIDLITEGMASGEDAAAMSGFVDIITVILTMIIQVVVFVFVFIGLRIATLILYWIIAAIIKGINKGKIKQEVKTNVESFEGNHKLSRAQVKLVNLIKEDQELLASRSELSKREISRAEKRIAKNQKKLIKKTLKRDRKPWWGALVGVAQGALVAICIMGPVSGITSNVGTLMKSLSEMSIQGEPMIDEKTKDTLNEIGILEYPETTTAKVYDAAGGWLYRSISKVENADGTITDIEAQIGAINGGIKMAEVLSRLAELDMDNGLTPEVREELLDVFNDLDVIKNDMSDEAVEQLGKLMQDVLGPMMGDADLPIDLSNVDFAKVNFANEGQVITSFYDLIEGSENGTVTEEEAIDEVIENLENSYLMLPILSSMIESLPEDEQPNLNAEDKAKIEAKIDALENQENAEAIKALFGIK